MMKEISEALNKYSSQLEKIDKENIYDTSLSLDQINFCFDCFKRAEEAACRDMNDDLYYLDWFQDMKDKLSKAFCYKKYGEI